MKQNDRELRLYYRRHFPSLITFLFLVILPLAAFSESEIYEIREIPKPFEERREEILVGDLENIYQELSPYQRWLLMYWQGKYAPLLDWDGVYAEYETWISRGSPVYVNLTELFAESGYFYLDDLRRKIKDTDFAPNEKAYLDILLQFLLDENSALDSSGSEWPIYLLAEDFLTEFPDSPYRPLVQDVILQKQKPSPLSLGVSLILGMNIPFGNIADYTGLPFFLIGIDFPITYHRFVFTLSILGSIGPITDSITYGGTEWYDTLGMLMWDFSLGYRIHPTRDFAVTPRIGIGGTRLKFMNWDPDESLRTDQRTTFSFGVALEFFNYNPFSGSLGKWALAVDYRHIPEAWDNDLTGSGLLVLVSLGTTGFSF